MVGRFARNFILPVAVVLERHVSTKGDAMLELVISMVRLGKFLKRIKYPEALKGQEIPDEVREEIEEALLDTFMYEEERNIK